MPGYIITNAEVFDKDAYGEYETGTRRDRRMAASF